MLLLLYFSKTFFIIILEWRDDANDDKVDNNLKYSTFSLALDKSEYLNLIKYDFLLPLLSYFE